MAADRVFLEGVVFYGYHGVNPEERSLGQRFVVDLEVTADLSAAGSSDDLAQTINYSRLFQVAREVVEGEPHNLLEAVAQDIAGRVLAGFPVDEVRVRVRKPGVAIKGSVLTSAGVEVVRHREAGT